MKGIIFTLFLCMSFPAFAEETSIRDELDLRAANIWHSIHNACMEMLYAGELTEDKQMAGPALMACVSVMYEDLAKRGAKKIREQRIEM